MPHPPTLPMSITACPVGEARSTIMSLGHVCEKPISVMVTELTTPVAPAIVKMEGKTDAMPKAGMRRLPPRI